MLRAVEALDYHERARRALRFWAIADALHALAIGATVVWLIPWKTPWVSALLLGYCAAKLGAGHGMWRLRRWGWRLGVVTAFLAFALCVVLAAGLVASWAYLKGVFGDFGRGTSIAALLFASVALQALGLFPALKLRALLGAEVRELLGVGKGWVRATLGLLALPPLAGLVCFLGFRVTPLPPVSEEGRAAALAHVRAALEDAPLPPLDALEGIPVGRDALYVTLWQDGKLRARVREQGADLAEAVRRAAQTLRGTGGLAGRAVSEGRLKFDRVVDVTWIPLDWQPLVALSVDAGLDGLRRVSADATRTRLPDDLVRSQRFGHAPLVPGIRELRFGLDAGAELNRLGMAHGRLERLRCESWVEFEGKALPVERGNTPAPSGPDAWREAAVAGGDFVLRQIRRDGRFHYQYFPITAKHPKGGSYSLPRHAGTVYALAELFARTGEQRFRDGVERAADWLVRNLPEQCGDIEGATCVRKGRFADLGSTALSMVGMLHYQRATKDDRYAGAVRRLARFVLHLQRPDGDFHHVYDLKARAIDADSRKMFFSEEASLALVLAAEELQDPEYRVAAERALDFLTGPKYSGYLVAHFIYGADHWTCIAAEEAWPMLKNPQYLDFCRGYAEFIRRMQYQPGEYAAADFLGHYGFGGFMVPQAPAAAGFSEAIVSTVLLARAHGVEDPDLEQQMRLGLDALARDQMRPDNAWLMRRPEQSYGGIRRSLVESEVRIDFTQHAVGALIRGAEVNAGRS